MGKQPKKEKRVSSDSAVDQLSGGGEMGALIRSTDWAQTALGPFESWPQSLKTAVSLILNSRYPMFLWWGEQLINIYNDGYIPVLGSRHPAALGQSAPEIWHEIWDSVGPLADSVIHQGQSTWSEKLPLHMERYGFPEETYFTFSYSPVLNDEGKVGGLFCACIEDTAQVVGERRLRALRELSNLTADARTTVEAGELTAKVIDNHPLDFAFGLVYLYDASEKHARLVGSSRLAPGSYAAPTILEPGDTGSFWPVAQAFRGEKALLRDLDPKQTLPGGAWPEPATNATMLPFGKSGQGPPTGVLVLGASPRRRFDEDYEAYFELFADGVESAISNAGAYEEEVRRVELLAELDRAKTAFFSNVSHEFRTPLTLMLGPLGDLLSKPQGGVLPENRDKLDVVHRNGQRLLRLVNSLLDFSRIEAGRMQASYAPVDLAALTTDLASVFRSAIEKAQMQFAIDCPQLPEPVYVDRDMWEKIVLNLLSNAFKYTLQGEIVISLRARDGSAVLAVRDTGTGIPAADVPKLFDRFYRVEGARGRTHEGSGIGLALVQELVKLHGGEVMVDSVEGRGSTFSVSVPFGKEHLPADRIGAGTSLSSTAVGAGPFVEEALRWLPAVGRQGGQEFANAVHEPLPMQRADRQGRPVKVILADDNADMRDYVRGLLEQYYTVVAVNDGEQALRAARELNPDLILTDVMMPNLDGFELLKALRQEPRTATIPVVMLSARAGEEAMLEGIRAGADDYLVKPFSARELLARVSGLLALARTRRDAALREQELLAETAKVLESIPQGYCAFDREFRFTYANPEAERILGQSNKALAGKTLWKVFPVGGEVEARLRRAMNDHVPLRLENYYGPWGRWFEIGAYPTSDGGLAVYFRDITSHKSAEEAKDRFAFLAENSTDFIATCGKDFVPTYINQAGLALVGLDSMEDALRKPLAEFFFPEDQAFMTEEFFPQVLRDGHGEVEIRFRHFKTGDAVWMTYNVVLLRDQAGNLTGLATISRNITDSKRAEQSLRESEARFRALTTNAPAAIFVKDLEGKYTLANTLACKALDRPEGVIGLTDHEMLSAEQADILRSHDLEVISTGRAIELEENVADRCFLSVKFPLMGDAGEPQGVCGVAVDITDRVRAERSLRESEERFRHMADNAPVMIWVTEPDGSCSFLNKPWYEFTGQNSTSAVRDAWLEAVHPDDREPVHEAFLAANARQMPFLMEYRLLRHDGEYRWTIDTAAPRFSADGKFVGFIGSVMDITERKQAEAALRVSEEQFRTLANSIPQLAWMARRDGYIFWYNQRWYDYTGTTLEQMKGWGWQSVHDPAELPRVLKTFKHSIAAEAPWEDTFPLRRNDGEMRWHLSRMVAVRDEDGNVVLWFGTNTDITERREMEQALREADRRKDEFLAMLGHELRNPLAAVSSGMTLLESRPSEERRAWIEQMMERQVQQLGRLVDDLLDVTRITQGKIQLRKQHIEIREQFDAVAESVRELMEERGHEFSMALPPEPIYVQADPARFEQILANLLTNAAKYTPNGGRIQLSAVVDRDEVAIRCTDNGIGMSSDELESVFQPFVQLNPSLDRTGSGLGMGLNLVRALVGMHGGNVAATSAGPGKGSEFTVRLPLSAGVEPQPAAISSVPEADAQSGDETLAGGETLDILLVDDNRDLAESAAMFLRDAGHHVTLAYEGEAALEIAERENPAVVLLDLGMPGLDGYQVAERIRMMPARQATTVVALSGYPPSKEDHGAPSVFDAYLVKPIDYRKLLQLLQQLRRETVSGAWPKPPATRGALAGHRDGQPGPRQEQPAKTAPNERHRILLVEDNRELAMLTAELLRNRGLEVQVAFTGAQALEQAGSFRPEVVLCDLNLPDQSGFEVARSLRQELPPYPVIVVGITADHTSAYAAEIETSPFDLFLSKPLAWDSVQKILGSLRDSTSASSKPN